MYRLFIILILSFLVGGIAEAAESASSEVNIMIEASQTLQEIQNIKSISTGDSHKMMLYGVLICVAIFVILMCVIKVKKSLMCLPLIIVMFLFFSQTIKAAETENVDVTVPSNLSIVFESDGTTSISEFTISNHTLLPISIKNIYVEELNGWKLCNVESEIPVDTKQLKLEIENTPIRVGGNIVDFLIGYEASKELDIQVQRGAWTKDHTPEEAFQLEMEYEFGTREFELSFDLSGGSDSYEEINVENGEIVQIPTPFRVGYEFSGWADSKGNLYKNQYTMPVGDECLKASWREVVGFVLYLKDDQSLRFVYLTEPISLGDLYDGISVSAIYPIPATAVYSSVSQVPWYDYNTYKTTVVKKVIVEDQLKPKSTAFWFYNMRDCELFQMEKLDTSQVTNMASMFGYAAYNAAKFEITGIGDFDVSQVTSMKGMFQYAAYNVPTFQCVIQDWKVYKVKDMSRMFEYMGYNSTSFSVGFLRSWNVQGVTNMDAMFYMTGYRANWYVFLASWKVSSTVSHVNFNYGVTSKVVAPW